MRSIFFSLFIMLAALGPTRASEKLPVVATFSILADMVQQVGGDRVTVTSLVGPGADAHTYSPAPSQVRLVARAKLIVMNGLGFEGWMDRLGEAAGYSGPIVVATTGVDPLTHDGDHEDHQHEAEHQHTDDHQHEGDHQHEDAHDHGAVDPHAWQDMANALIYIKNIRDGLCAIDQDNCPLYTANEAAYQSKISNLDAKLRQDFSAIPQAQRKIITSHDAFGYFQAAYGLQILAPQGVSTDAEPSAASIAALIRQIKHEQIRAVFVENITNSRVIDQIAQETGAAIGGTLYSDALSDEAGPAATYLDMMQHNAQQMIAALKR